MISEIVLGVLSSWIPLAAVSVWGWRHVLKEWPVSLSL